MESETINSLKQAASHIRAGDIKSARTILVALLREEPDNAQAWFMLSYAVPKLEKQIYSVQQTLRLEPDNEKAQRRLAKLTGQTPPPAAAPQPEQTPAPKEAPADDSGADLLSQRLFGEEAEKPPQTAQKPFEPTREKEDAETASPLMDISDDSAPHDAYEMGSGSPYVDADDDEEGEKEKKLPKINLSPEMRKVLIYGAIGLVGLLLLSFMVIKPLTSMLMSIDWFSRQGDLAPEEVEATLFVQAQLPTFTPAPPTSTPYPSPTPVVQELFTIQDLEAPSAAALTEMTQIEAALQRLTGLFFESAPDIYSVSESRLQNFGWDFSKTDNFSEDVSNTETVFEVLGLANTGSDFSSLYQNLWLDPNGTFYQPEKNFIATAGFELSAYQKYSFAQAYVQWLRNQQFPFTDLGYYPPCIFPSDNCLATLAMIKGEAAFTAYGWAMQDMTEEDRQTIQEATPKYFLIPVISPSTAMQSIHEFPYVQGFTFAESLYQSGGWNTINAIYANPPQTTEQILHPAKYLQGEVAASVESTDLTGILGGDQSQNWQPIFQGTLGEWNTYLILSASTSNRNRLDTDGAAAAAAGWNGDFAQIFTTPSGSRVLTIHWKWDTQDDANAFLDGLNYVASNRVGGLPAEIAGYTCNQSASETSCVVAKGQDVIWVLTQDSDLAQLILENYDFLGAN
ncbi:hypothetical protein KQH61_05010 [bacterium]|nr:hypothetical protein [bacterium]MCB2179261.1 hypothetical protein [bacterium]